MKIRCSCKKVLTDWRDPLLDNCKVITPQIWLFHFIVGRKVWKLNALNNWPQSRQMNIQWIRIFGWSLENGNKLDWHHKEAKFCIYKKSDNDAERNVKEIIMLTCGVYNNVFYIFTFPVLKYASVLGISNDRSYDYAIIPIACTC